MLNARTLLLTALLCVGCTRGTDPILPPESGDTLAFDALDETDRAALTQMARIFEIFKEDAAGLWGEGFRVDQMPIVLLRRDGGVGAHAYLIGHPAWPDGATPLALPAELAALEGLHRVEALSRYPDADADYELVFDAAGVEAFVMPYATLGTDPFGDVDDDEWVRYFVHEAFHRYQEVEGGWGWPEWSTQDLADYPFEPEATALAVVEHRALAVALMATDGAGRATAARHFLAVRRERRGRWPIVRALDDSQEKSEGMPRFMEVNLTDHLDGRSGMDELVVELALMADLESFRDEAGLVLGFDRFYLTGASVGVLLERSGGPWRARLDDTDTMPVDLLEEVIPLADPDAALAEARVRYGYDDLLEAAASLTYDTDLGF